jgi:hypothetical protein
MILATRGEFDADITDKSAGADIQSGCNHPGVGSAWKV